MTKKFLIAAAIGSVALFTTACGDETGSASSNAKKDNAPTWTVKKVQKEYQQSLNSDVDLDDLGHLSVSCILESGEEGKQGKLLCHVEGDDETFTVEIVVPPNGMWISKAA